MLGLECDTSTQSIIPKHVSNPNNQILPKELMPDMEYWEELVQENAFGYEGRSDHLPACLAHMLYCIVAEQPYNLAYFFIKRIE